ncbi:TolC family protein [Methylocystis sp. IM3]|jgi:outer membrane protein TolC|uniref:TolC family protein n=1 Tax=unclassified Methylocystis TaxID=2625913 RepID=UPI0030F67DEC
MRQKAAIVALSLCTLTADAIAGPKPTGRVTLKGDQPIEKRRKAPLGHVLMRHLDMAVAIDAQSQGLAAQFGAVTARFATTRSITPGSPYLGGTQRNAVAGNLRNYNETEVEAGLPLWLPGQRDAMETTVATGAIEVEERIALRRLEVAGLLRNAWWNAQRAAREASVARNRVVTAREIGVDMARRVELGEAAQADALLAKNELLAAETELAQAEGAEKVARVNYEALTGGAPPDGTLETLKPACPIEDHPALRTPTATLRRAEAQLQLVEATPIDSPDVAVFGRQEHNRQYSTDHSQPITDQLTNATTVGVRLRIPLPTDGRQGPRRAKAHAEITRAHAHLEKARRVVLAEIKAARAHLAAVKRASSIANKRLGVAKEQFELARRSFALGEIGGLDFYRIRQLQLDAQRAQAAMTVAVGVAISRLNQAQGYAPD